MQAFMEPDKIGALPVGIGANAPAPEAAKPLPVRPVYGDVLKAAMSLTIDEQRWLYAAMFNVIREDGRKGFVNPIPADALRAAREFAQQPTFRSGLGPSGDANAPEQHIWQFAADYVQQSGVFESLPIDTVTGLYPRG